jgi:starch synthase
LCTREYPPEVYGGAGVQVEYLAKELSKHVDLTVHCQGADRPTAVAHQPWDRLKSANPALQTISTGLSMVAEMGDVDLVHSHTWYANMGGHLTSLLYGIPHVFDDALAGAASAVEGRTARRRLRAVVVV